MKTKLFAIAALAAGMVAGNANAQTSVAADITVNTTWSGTIILEQPIFVRSGAVLTILPGTIVRGQPRTDVVTPGSTTGTPGALIVTREGRIVANGTESAPIIMTTAAVDNDNDGIADDDDSNGFDDPWVAGDTFLDDTPTTAPLAPLDGNGEANVSKWGGLVVLGSAPTNLADEGVGYGEATVEGLTVPGFDPAFATYGGDDPNDNSGILRYVSVRHAGDEIGNGNELNGITLAGVGMGTRIDFVEVYANFDDGIEWFGGTVGGTNLVLLYIGDDSLDVDQGYTGVNQFVFVVMPWFNENDTTSFGSRSGDKAGELDGDDFAPDAPALPNVNLRINETLTATSSTPSPLSNFQFHNVTVIGSTPDVGQEFTPTSAASTNRGIQIRNGGNGYVFHSIIVNTGAETGLEIDTGIGDGAPGFDTLDNVNNGTTGIVCSTMDDGAALAAAELTAVANGDALAVALGGVAPASNNVVNSLLFPGLVNEDVTHDPQGNAAGKLDGTLKASVINPRPNFGLTGLIGCPAIENSQVTPVTFRGAFDRTAPRLWTTGWTVLSIADLIAD